MVSSCESRDATIATLHKRIAQLEKLVAQLTNRIRELEERQAEQRRTASSLLTHVCNEQLQQRRMLRQLLNRCGLLEDAIDLPCGHRAQTLLASLSSIQATTTNIEGEASELATPIEAVTAPAGAPTAGFGAGAWQAMNPDISVIGDFMVRLGGKNPLGSYRGSLLREVELAFQAYADPFGRLDAFVHLSGEHAHIEQAELTILDPRVLSLPEGLEIHGGVLLANIGKVNTIHIPEQPMADPPLLHQFFYAHAPKDVQNPTPLQILNHILEHGTHNFHGTGIRFSYMLPTEQPGRMYEVSIDALNAHNLTFDCHHGRPVLLGRFRSFFELVPLEHTLDVGFNYGYGPNPAGGNTHLYSIDFTYRWRPIGRGLYKSLAWYNEFAVARRSSINRSNTATGWFSMLEYQLTRTLFMEMRYDWASLPDSSLHGSGVSFALTYYPTEFGRYRLQINRRRYSPGGTIWDFILEATFSIGIHRPHPF